MCSICGKKKTFTKPSYSAKWLVVLLKELVSLSNESGKISSDLQEAVTRNIVCQVWADV